MNPLPDKRDEETYNATRYGEGGRDEHEKYIHIFLVKWQTVARYVLACVRVQRDGASADIIGRVINGERRYARMRARGKHRPSLVAVSRLLYPVQFHNRSAPEGIEGGGRRVRVTRRASRTTFTCVLWPTAAGKFCSEIARCRYGKSRCVRIVLVRIMYVYIVGGYRRTYNVYLMKYLIRTGAHSSAHDEQASTLANRILAELCRKLIACFAYYVEPKKSQFRAVCF